jgi:hypothetical protein
MSEGAAVTVEKRSSTPIRDNTKNGKKIRQGVAVAGSPSIGTATDSDRRFAS